MLTDIFAERYAARVLWEQHTEAETKLLMQCFRIIAKQLIPYWIDEKESATAKAKWAGEHNLSISAHAGKPARPLVSDLGANTHGRHD
jgi:hypothetical protein